MVRSQANGGVSRNGSIKLLFVIIYGEDAQGRAYEHVKVKAEIKQVRICTYVHILCIRYVFKTRDYYDNQI